MLIYSIGIVVAVAALPTTTNITTDEKKKSRYIHTHTYSHMQPFFFLLFSCFLFVNSIQPNAQLHMRIYIVCDNQYLCGLFIYYYYFSHFVSCLFNIKLIWLLLEIFSFSCFPIASLLVNTHTNIEGIEVVKCRSKNK